MSTYPIFRADHVGSFLRPAYLLQARKQFQRHEIPLDALREVENRAITEVVHLQENAGIRSVTDGEFRRTYFHLDFLQQLGGVTTEVPTLIITAEDKEKLSPPIINVSGKVVHNKAIQLADFNYLKSQCLASSVPKVTIPSPTMLHFRSGREGISKLAYPELYPDFYNDVANAYVKELTELYHAGCRHIQFDDTNLAYLCDDKMRKEAHQRGQDPTLLPFQYADFINQIVALKPKDLVLSIHLCRGNFRSTYAANGHYEPVAEALLSHMNLDAYFLEYDDDRSGDFKPLRYLPKNKIAVLGLISSKFPQLEAKDVIKRRIEEATQYVPLEQLALSAQCGFSSTVHGNCITEQEQRLKLEHIVNIAHEVWGELVING